VDGVVGRPPAQRLHAAAEPAEAELMFGGWLDE
jgi:hypothetical protein